MKRIRWKITENRRRNDGVISTCYGITFGWWPCLHGPYLQLAWGSRRIDLWYGLPSYNNERKVLRESAL